MTAVYNCHKTCRRNHFITKKQHVNTQRKSSSEGKLTQLLTLAFPNSVLIGPCLNGKPGFNPINAGRNGETKSRFE